MYFFRYCYGGNHDKGYALNRKIEAALNTANNIALVTGQWAHIMYNEESSSVYVVCEDDFLQMSLYEQDRTIIKVTPDSVRYTIRYLRYPSD